MAGFLTTEFPQTSRLLPVRSLPKIRLDRAQRQSGTQSASVGNNSFIYLFNNSPQSQLLVVRGLHWGPAASGPVNLTYGRAPTGTQITTGMQPVLADRAQLPGQVWVVAIAFTTNPDFVLYAQSLEQAISGEYPSIVLPPSYSLVVNTQAVNLALTASFLWEALTPDEFTEMYGSYS